MVELAVSCIFRGSNLILLNGIKSFRRNNRQNIILLAICPSAIQYMIAESIIFHLRDDGLWWAFTFI
jgi:hypothetical protein